MNFFKNLDDYANEYLKKHEKLRKGSDYYNNFDRNVNECCGGINNFLQKRFDEKNALIQSLTGFNPNQQQNFNNNNFNNNFNNNNNNDSNDFLNPSKNLYTNLNVKQFNYSEQQKLDKMKYSNVKYNNIPQNNFNNNNNNFPQNNFNPNNN